MTIRKTLANIVLGASLITSPYLVQTPNPIHAAQQASSSQAGVIDLQPADGGNTKSQEDWIRYFNEQGKAMISAPDIYRAAQTGSDQLVKLFREGSDLMDIMDIITSTRIIYNPDDLTAKIVHNYGSTVVKPTEKQVVIPVYKRKTSLSLGTQEGNLSEVLGTEEGKTYLRALFDTNDTPENIGLTLQILSGKGTTNVVISTLEQSERKARPENVVWFTYNKDKDRLKVHGDAWVGGIGGSTGRSRGVSIK